MKKLIPLLTFFIVISCDFSNSLTNEQLYSIEKDAEEISKILIIIDEGSDKFMDKVYEGFNQDDFETKNLNKTIEKVKLILIDLFKDITRSKGLLVKYQNLSKDYQKNLLKILENKLYNNLSLKNEIRANTPEAYISKSIRTLEREIALGRKTLEEMDSLKNDSLISSSQSVTFKDGQTLNISKLNQDIIDVVGASNLLISKSATDKFNKCLFEKIAKNSSYAKYREDLQKSKNHSDNKEERMYYLYSVPYINAALWGCVESDNNLINEFAQIDKIIPQSDKKIEIFGLEILKDIKKEIGINKYNEYGKNVDWKSFSECLARKMWSSFTPKQMMNPSKETDNLGEKFFEDCMMETSGIKL